MTTCSKVQYDLLLCGIIKFINTTYNSVVPHWRIMFTGLIELFASVFGNFKKLSKEQQNRLVNINFNILNKVDVLYRSTHHFPEDDTILSSYLTIFSIH
ncbi:hypothetical protein PMAYCL1PPCAC_10643, partial [Pristionchus mayeri]